MRKKMLKTVQYYWNAARGLSIQTLEESPTFAGAFETVPRKKKPPI